MPRFSLPLLAVFIVALLCSAGCRPRETRVVEGNRTGVIHIGNASEPSDLDPQLATSITDAQVILGLMEGLTSQDPRDSHPVPGLAERWESSADGLTWTFHLRPDARWSNQDPVTAGDFVYAFQRILSPGLAAEYAYMLHCIAGAKAFNSGEFTDFSRVGVRATDERTLVLTLVYPVPYLPSLAMHQSWFPVHRATIEKYGRIDERGSRWTRPGNYVGTGPFLLAEWKPNQVIRLTKNPAYHDAASVRLNEVNFYPIEDRATEESSFRAGQLHITATLPVDKIPAYKADHPESLRQEVTFATTYLTFNTTRPPLNDARVRRALSLTLNRRDLTDKVLKGSRIPAYTLVPPGIPGYPTDPVVREDIAEARRLLAEAGFPEGKGLRKLEILGGKGGNPAFNEAIQQMWRTQLGIEVSIYNEEGKVFFDSLRTKNYDIAGYGWVGDYLDPSTFAELMTRRSGNNHSGWTSPDYDKLIDEATVTADNIRRFALYRQAEHLLFEAMPITPITYGSRNYLCTPGVQGWHGNLLDLHPLVGVSLKE